MCLIVCSALWGFSVTQQFRSTDARTPALTNTLTEVLFEGWVDGGSVLENAATQRNIQPYKLGMRVAVAGDRTHDLLSVSQ